MLDKTFHVKTLSGIWCRSSGSVSLLAASNLWCITWILSNPRDKVGVCPVHHKAVLKEPVTPQSHTMWEAVVEATSFKLYLLSTDVSKPFQHAFPVLSDLDMSNAVFPFISSTSAINADLPFPGRLLFLLLFHLPLTEIHQVGFYLQWIKSFEQA